MTEILSGALTEENLESIISSLEGQYGAIEIAVPVDDDADITKWWFVSVLQPGTAKQVLVVGNPRTYARFRREHLQ